MKLTVRELRDFFSKSDPDTEVTFGQLQFNGFKVVEPGKVEIALYPTAFWNEELELWEALPNDPPQVVE